MSETNGQAKRKSFNPAGRPLKNINPQQVAELAAIGCTMIEMAAVLDCSVDTLENRFSDVIKKNRQEFKMSLRRFQYRAAEEGDRTMLVWLGKQYLEQTDKREQTNTQVSADDQARVNAAIESFRHAVENDTGKSLTREEAIQWLAPHIPEVRELGKIG